MSKKIVLIDGHSILNRAYYGIPQLTNSKGIPTNAVYGFLNIMFKLLDEEKADYLTVAFDVEQPVFRHEMFPEYKGTRKGMPEELKEQVPLIKKVLKAMGICILEKPGFEADDILGTLAKQSEAKGFEVSVVSGDRDLLQIASDTIKVRIPTTKRTGTEIEDYYAKDVREKMGIEPCQVIEMKALMGDTADNIPGVPGIGEKTALKILGTFQTIEHAYEHMEEVSPNRVREALRNHYDLAKLSKTLATIKTDCELEYDMEQAKIDNIYSEEACHIIKELEFKSMLKRFDCDITVSNQGEEENFVKITKTADAMKVWKELELYQLKTDFVLGFGMFQREGNTKLSVADDGQLTFAGLGLEDEKEEVLYGAAFSFEGKEGFKTYYISTEDEITSAHIIEKLKTLKMEGVVSVLDLKELLFEMPEGCLKTQEHDPFFDCKVAAYLLNPLKDSYGCDDIARDYVSLTIPSYTEYFGKGDLEEAVKKEKEFLNYACYSAYIAKIAYQNLTQKLEEANMTSLYYDIELPLVTTLYDMEKRGVHVNKEELVKYGQKLGERIVLLESEIYELAGEKFNINSPKQLGVILFEKMNMPFAKKTKTGYSTSADVLEKLRCEHPIIDKILEYRQLTKLKSTYADGLAAYIKEDGRIHGKFNQTITATGRISSTEPNLQNIPIRMELGKEIRKVFVPKEGYVFLDADYSQIELRVLAHMSGDETLIEAYQEGKDIHRITASQVFHIPFEEVTSKERSDAKAVNFGIVYGSTGFGLSQNLNISKKEADQYIKKYFATYPKIKEFLDGLIESGKEKGYVETMYHRIRPVPELKASSFMQRAAGERIAMNSPIQGTAADIIKIAMVRVNEKLKDMKLKSQLILQVHDELLIETDMDEIGIVKKILHDEMFHAANLDVPLEVDVQQGTNWFEAH